MAISGRFFTSSYKILSVLLLIFSILRLISSLKQPLNSGYGDFGIYHKYTNIFLSGKSPYDPHNTDGKPLAYPPSALMFFMPIALMPVKQSFLLFSAISIIFYLLTTYLFLRKFLPSTQYIFLIIAALLQIFPVVLTLEYGQINLIVLSLLNLVFIFDQDKKVVLTSIAWGTTLLIKPSPLLLFVYFLLKKRYLTLIICLTLPVLFNLLFLKLLPDSLYYWNTILPLLSKTDFYTFFYDQSLYTFFLRAGLPDIILIPRLIILILLCLIIWKYFLQKKSTFSDLVLYSQLLILATISNAFAWQHHFVLVQPALIAGLIIFMRKKNWLVLTILILSFILIAYHIPEKFHPHPSLPFNSNPFYVTHTLFGALIIFFLLLYV